MAQQQGIGFRGGPGRNMGAPTEKPANMMQSLKRLFSYFGSEKFYVFLLIFCVSAGVLCGSFAPRMQSNAIDAVVRGSYGQIYGQTDTGPEKASGPHGHCVHGAARFRLGQTGTGESEKLSESQAR